MWPRATDQGYFEFITGVGLALSTLGRLVLGKEVKLSQASQHSGSGLWALGYVFFSQLGLHFYQVINAMSLV